MVSVLITGENGYVGNSFQKWLARWPNDYIVDTISVRGDTWKRRDFSKYDVVIHTAAIAHKKEEPEMKELCFRINRDLTLEIAEKAKSDGVKQFVFISTMAIYGLEGKVGEGTVITKETTPNPNTFYGQSKLEAEELLLKLADDNFRLAIIRPPMIYGPNCPGNYARLRKLALITPVFPLINNQRSVIHIDYLSEVLKSIILHRREGCYFPQNPSYMNTSNEVKEIARASGKQIYLSKSLGFLILYFGKNISLINKIFGNLVYQID